MDSDGNVWPGDLLNRQLDAKIVEEFLVGRMEERRRRGLVPSYVLNINAAWGSGKTFFLRRFQEDLRSRGHSVYVNAWEDDFHLNPMAAVMAAIDTELRSVLSKKSPAISKWERVKKVGAPLAKSIAASGLKTGAKKLVGEVGLQEIISLWRGTGQNEESTIPDEMTKAVLGGAIDAIKFETEGDPITEFTRTKRQIADFKGKLADLVSTLQNGQSRKYFFVLVDELDRCRPSYAIALLENMKHLFSVPGVIFVVATDTVQLASSVKAIYGSEFDAQKYLLRFFDRSYRFEEPTRSAFIAYLVQEHQINVDLFALPPKVDLVSLLEGVFTSFRCELRDIEQCIDILTTCVTLWSSRSKINVLYLLPIIIAHQQGWSEIFASLVDLNLYGRTDVFTFKLDNRFSVRFGRSADAWRAADEERADLLSMLVEISRTYRMSSSEIVEQTESSKSKKWIRSEIIDEAQYSGIDRDTKLDLLPKRYGSLVRSAGRLTAAP